MQQVFEQLSHPDRALMREYMPHLVRQNRSQFVIALSKADHLPVYEDIPAGQAERVNLWQIHKREAEVQLCRRHVGEKAIADPLQVIIQLRIPDHMVIALELLYYHLSKPILLFF